MAMGDSKGWFHLPRVPEPEVMESREETEVYTSAASQFHLDQLDNTFVAHALSLGIASGRVLDIGTGPGQIPIKLALKAPRAEITGLDLSEAMLVQARHDAQQNGVADRVRFQIGDAKKLSFPDSHFDGVICNSLLHHVADPLATLNEIARVVQPKGAILLRDLRRPGTLALPFHLFWYGRHYSGLMKKLFADSVRAAYTETEMDELLRQSKISGARVFRKGRSHIGIERRAGQIAQ